MAASAELLISVYVMGVQSGGGRYPDRKRDEIGYPHANECIQGNPLIGSPALVGVIFLSGSRFGFSFRSSASSEACQKKRYGLIVAPKMATIRRQEVLPKNVMRGMKNPTGEWSPVDFDDKEGCHIGE